MYKILFAALMPILIACKSASAQSMTINDLIRFHRLSRDQLDDVMTARGYYYVSPHKLDDGLVSQAYAKSKSNGTKTIHFWYYQGSVLLVTAYFTSSQSEYTALKNQLKQKGYKYVRSKDLEGMTNHYYENSTSPKYEATISQSYNSDAHETVYEVAIKDSGLYDRALREIDQRKEGNGLN